MIYYFIQSEGCNTLKGDKTAIRISLLFFLGYKMPLQMPSTAKYLAAVQGCYNSITIKSPFFPYFYHFNGDTTREEKAKRRRNSFSSCPINSILFALSVQASGGLGITKNLYSENRGARYKMLISPFNSRFD